MACEKCKAFGGLWMETPRGLRRCDCADGRRLSEKPKPLPPVLTAKQAEVFAEMLASIPFFPSERGARMAIGDELRVMCAGPKEAEWLVKRMRQLYNRWPGPLEMRRVYCDARPPLDAVAPVGISEVYPDGIPSEHSTAPQLAAAPMRQLPEGRSEAVIEDPKIAAAIEKAARKLKRLPAAEWSDSRFSMELREIETPPNHRPELPGPTPQVITPEDCDRAVAELRAAKTRAAGDGEGI